MAGLMTAIDVDRDQDLLAMHLSGDPAAFGELYAQHYDRLLRHVRQRVRDWHLAEEIVQDTFVRAYEAAAHLKDHRRFYPWVRVIADRLAIDVFRRDGRVSPVAEFDEIGHEPAADERLIAASEAEALRAALGRVRERHRQVLDWQNSGLSYERIAERLDTPVTTVPPLLFRARQALRREYLALTDERMAAVPVLGTVLHLWRRTRTRTMQLVSGLPDISGLAVPMAGVVIGGVLFGPPGGGVVQLDSASASASHANASQDLGAEEPQGHEAPGGETPADRGTAAAQTVPPPDHVVGGVELTLDPGRRDWGRERMRDMPIYYEVGDVAFGADPGAMERDVGRTLAGDIGWMEGECGQQQQGC